MPSTRGAAGGCWRPPNLVFAAGLLLLAVAPVAEVMLLGWLVLGVAMAMGLYDAAFATLAGLFGRGARGPITGITLIAGLASTIGWPISALPEDAFDWRGACLAWAALHLFVGWPINRWLVPTAPPPERAAAIEADATPPPRFAIGAAALLGPAQVGARVAEFGLLRRFHPLASARLATLGHPLGVGVLLLAGGPAAAVFAVLHGMGNGILTIAKGTLPLAVFGPAGFGARQGLLAAPSRLLQAASPFAFGLPLETSGVAAALTLTSVLSISACLALLAIRRAPPA